MIQSDDCVYVHPKQPGDPVPARGPWDGYAREFPVKKIHDAMPAWKIDRYPSYLE